MTQLLGDAFRRWPDRPALRVGNLKISYRELDLFSDRMAHGLRRMGVQVGTHVGLYLPTTAHYFIAFFAVLKAGGTVVNYSPLDAGTVLRHKVEDSRTEFMVTLDLPEMYSMMNAFLGETGLKALIVGTASDFNASADSNPTTIQWNAQRVAFSSLLEAIGPGESFTAHTVSDLSTLAVLQYTGGTTGQPKGAMLSHANLSAAVSQVWHTLVGAGTLKEGEERFLCVLPLFHIYSLVVNMLFGISTGSELILHQRFELEPVLNEIVDSRVTVFLGVPTMYVAFTGHPHIGRIDLSSLKFCNSGGAPIAAEVYEKFVRLAQCRLQEGWGMTETCAMATASPGVGVHLAGSCGIPVPGIEVKVIDLHSQTEVPFGVQGELCVRGPNVMQGYWNNPHASAEALTPDGFLRTGDVGYMTDAGFVYIVDRTKDMIICGGFNVYPRIIEEAIYRHPSVEEVAVIGIPDAYRGQSPKAFVKLKAGSEPLTLPVLCDFLTAFLGKHEMPRALVFRAELPKTPVGKLSKKELNEEEQQASFRSS